MALPDREISHILAAREKERDLPGCVGWAGGREWW